MSNEINLGSDQEKEQKNSAFCKAPQAEIINNKQPKKLNDELTPFVRKRSHCEVPRYTVRLKAQLGLQQKRRKAAEVREHRPHGRPEGRKAKQEETKDDRELVSNGRHRTNSKINLSSSRDLDEDKPRRRRSFSADPSEACRRRRRRKSCGRRRRRSRSRRRRRRSCRRKRRRSCRRKRRRRRSCRRKRKRSCGRRRRRRRRC